MNPVTQRLSETATRMTMYGLTDEPLVVTRSEVDSLVEDLHAMSLGRRIRNKIQIREAVIAGRLTFHGRKILVLEGIYDAEKSRVRNAGGRGGSSNRSDDGV